ncbi:MAG: hypothetical protein ACYS9X_19475, partial [Planctomycetota bacterium]|jgi:hypothetical protein
VRQFRAIGVKLIATNVWMLTATKRVLHDQPEYQKAVCFDIAGERIVPAWLDSSYKGVRPYWGCTNHPLFRKQLVERLKTGFAAGANMLHLDDHLGTSAAANHSGGCFCDQCMSGFGEWLADKIAAGEISREELARKGVADVGTFDYRALVRGAGFTTREAYKKGFWARKVPLRDEFLAFQRDAAAAFVKELGDLAAEVAGERVPVGTNAYNLSPTQISDSHHADYFANEVQHWGVEDRIPPFVYRLGDALGKPVFSTGSGDGWARADETGCVVRLHRWIATAHAFGHHFMNAWKRWGFSKETGTRWCVTPVSMFEEICGFIAENAELFDDYEPVAQVGLLYSNRACLRNKWGVRDAAREFHYANVPFGLAVAGDDWLKRELTEAELSRFELVVVPEPAMLEGAQGALVESWRRKGKAVTWTNAAEVLARVKPLVAVEDAPKVWALPRRIPSRPGAPVVIHLLNQDYDEKADAMRGKVGFKVRVRNALLPGGARRKVTLFAPGAEPKPAAIAVEGDDLVVTVPTLELWGILKLE